MVDRDRVEALADLEVDRGAILVDGSPASTAAGREPDPSQHERSMDLVLEGILGIDASLDCDVAWRPGRELPCLGDRHDGGDREQPSDPIVRSERAQDRDARGQGDHTQGDGDEGCHVDEDTRRTWKGPKEPPRHVGVDAIAAVSIVRPLRAEGYATGAGPGGSTAVVHECASTSPGYPPIVHNAVSPTRTVRPIGRSPGRGRCAGHRSPSGPGVRR